MNELKRVGKSADPYETPLGKLYFSGRCAIVDSVVMSTYKEDRQPFLIVSELAFVMLIFCMRSVLGTVSKALLMSLVQVLVRSRLRVCVVSGLQGVLWWSVWL